MKRSFIERENIISPPLSPNKSHNNGEKRVPNDIIPLNQSKSVTLQALMLLNELSYNDDEMIDDLIIDKPVKIVIFLDAQGKQFIDFFQNQMPDELKVLVIFVSHGLKEDQITNDHLQNSILVNNSQCTYLTKTFKLLHPLGGGIYPLNYLTIISNGLVRVKLPIRLSQYNPHEKFGVSINDIGSLLYEILPFLY